MMPAVWNALLCGVVAAIATNLAYVKSNLLLLGDTTRRGRHLLWDPLAFDAMGFVFGLVVGAACALGWPAASPWQPIVFGIAITLAAIAAVAGVVTYRRYAALPRDPLREGPAAELEFELRLPAGRSATSDLPQQGVLGSGVRSATQVQLAPQQLRSSDERVVLPGRVALRFAAANPLLSIRDHHDVWINFDLPLPAQPTAADLDWSPWLTACNAARGMPAAMTFQIRYRVRFTPTS